LKNLIFILSSIAMLLVGAVALIAQYRINQKELELNRNRTEKARQTRLENLRNGRAENPVEDVEILETQIN